MADPLFQHWFHGRITRIEAEEILARNGKKDGLYLLRESTASAGSYALSMCHNNKIIHYHIQRHSDGTVAIEDGKKFPGPVELIHHHRTCLDGLLARLTEPCNRLPGVPPKTYSGANQEHIKDAAIAAMASMGIQVCWNQAHTCMHISKVKSTKNFYCKNSLRVYVGFKYTRPSDKLFIYLERCNV